MHPPTLPASAVEEAEAEAEEPDVIIAEPVEAEPEVVEETGEVAAAEVGETAEEAERRHRRRRRRRRGGHREEGAPASAAELPAAFEAASPEAGEAAAAETHIEGVPEHAEAVAEDEPRGRRRGRRGGRRRRPDGADGEMPSHAEPGADQPDLPPVYSGPTPADPFGGHAFDIFDVLDRVEVTAATPDPVGAPEPEPDPAVQPEPELASAVVAEPLSVQADASGAEPVPEPVAIAKDAPEPLIKPIVIGDSETPVVERKRGWWRR
jgi:ribonuclease E